MAPRDLFVTANRLRHHLVDWGGGGANVLLLHGFLEHARVWDFVAPRLVAAGFRVLALDWRGHGDSDHVGTGGYYHFADYVADLAGIVREIGGRAALVAHSMGGGAAVLYAGTEPDRVWALVSVEGLGVPDPEPDDAPHRYAQWILDLERVGRRRRPGFTLEDAAQRLRERFPPFTSEVARHLAEHGTRRVAKDATARLREWKFDPLHQSRAPAPTPLAQARAFWKRVACPVLYVEGEQSMLRLSEEDLSERLAALRASRMRISDASHHPHLERPDETARVITQFLRDGSPRSREEDEGGE